MPEATLSVRDKHMTQPKPLGFWRAMYCVALLLCGLLAGHLLALAMRNGMGISSDSIAYIGISEHIVAGKGLNWIAADGSLTPMTHFPPMYPLLLAGIQMAGLNSIEAARLINTLIFGANVVLIGWFIHQLSRNAFAVVMGSLLAACSPIMISWHSMAMTEPIFIFFMLLGMGILNKYFDTKKPGLLVIVGIIYGMHYLTRYAGLSIIFSSTIAILLNQRLISREKIRSILILLLLSLTPMVVWIGRNMYLAGTFTNRRLIWHPPSVSKLKHAFGVFWKWIFPYEFTYTALYGLIICLLVAVLVLVIYCRKVGGQECLRWLHRTLDNHLLTILLVYVLCYSITILATMTFFDASTPMDIRITLPLYIMFLILLPTALVWYTRRMRNTIRHMVLFVVGGLLLISYTDQSVDLIDRISVYPRGYGSETKQVFADIDEIRSLPSDIVIYTNNIEGLYFQFNQYGHRTPIGLDRVTELNSPDYDQELGQMREALESDKAVLILFHTHLRDFPSEWIEDLESFWEYKGTVLYAAQDFYDRIH